MAVVLDDPGRHVPGDPPAVDPLALVGLAAGWVRPGSRLDRAGQPRAAQVRRRVAVEFGVCVRPVLLRRVDLDTGVTEVVEQPCGSTRTAVCPPCAKKARALRATQCREGWHLDVEPDLTPSAGTARDRSLVEHRARLVADREQAIAAVKADPADTNAPDRIGRLEDVIADLDEQLAKRGVKGRLEPDLVKRRARRRVAGRTSPTFPGSRRTGPASVARSSTRCGTGCSGRRCSSPSRWTPTARSTSTVPRCGSRRTTTPAPPGTRSPGRARRVGKYLRHVPEDVMAWLDGPDAGAA